MSKICGIYGIRNTVNGKWLVGSSIDVKRRWKEHRNRADSNRHDNPHFQQAWNRYGDNAFEWSVLELCASDMLVLREDAHMAYHKSMDERFGYNMASANKICITDAVRQHMSESGKGRKFSDEHKRKIAIASAKHRHTPETRMKLSLMHRGRKMPKWNEESRKRHSLLFRGSSNPMFGKKATKETRQKMSLAHKGNKSHTGRTFSSEHLQHLSEAHRGRKHPEEVKLKISSSQLGSLNHRYGKSISEDHKQAIRTFWAARRAAKLASQPQLALGVTA
jgi:group I intron endonuclease